LYAKRKIAGKRDKRREREREREGGGREDVYKIPID
jgi:hypothetical protein